MLEELATCGPLENSKNEKQSMYIALCGGLHGVDSDIEKVVCSDLSSQTIRNSTPVAPLHPWFWQTKPWEKMHINFNGLFLNIHTSCSSMHT